MFRCLQLSVVCLGACAVLAAPLRAEGTRELSIIASAQDSPRCGPKIGPVLLNELGGVVIRSAEELVAHSGKPGAAKDAAGRAALEAELVKVLQVDAIDWSKHMVLAVRGEMGTRADRIQFEALRVEGKVLTVAWKVNQRPPHAGPGTPLALILVERFDGEVKFVH
jgi:hypothetical protein